MDLAKIKKLINLAADLFFPPRCVFCGCVVSPGTKVCRKCAQEVVETSAIRYMNLSVSGENIRCAALYTYRGVVRKSIVDFKFNGHREYADYYAEQLAEQSPKSFPDFRFDAVTSVPISAERKKKRGYNQSEWIARPLARRLNLPYRELLVKTRDNREQHMLDKKQRAKNVRGVYSAAGTGAEGKSILLVDDIVTTGATLSECARVLYGAGAKLVSCAAVAQVPPGS